MAYKRNEFPRTMTRGKFKGQRFETQNDYGKALRDSIVREHNGGKPKRKSAAKRAKSTSNGGPSAVRTQIQKDEHAEGVIWIISMYESYIEVGATPEEALTKTIEMSR